jgi:hypothetical protein
MKFRNFIYAIINEFFGGYGGIRLKKQIEKRLKNFVKPINLVVVVTEWTFG